MLNSLTGLAVIRWKTEMGNSQPSFETLLPHQPIGRTLLSCQRPFVQARCHKGFISAKVDHRANAERTYQLISPDWAWICHGGTLRSEKRGAAVSANEKPRTAIAVDVAHRRWRCEGPSEPEWMLLRAGRIHQWHFLRGRTKTPVTRWGRHGPFGDDFVEQSFSGWPLIRLHSFDATAHRLTYAFNEFGRRWMIGSGPQVVATPEPAKYDYQSMKGPLSDRD
jgi:hypothetical protein